MKYFYFFIFIVFVLNLKGQTDNETFNIPNQRPFEGIIFFSMELITDTLYYTYYLKIVWYVWTNIIVVETAKLLIITYYLT